MARICKKCHSFRLGGRDKFGPNLAHLFGRRAGEIEGYPYSLAMRERGIVWESETLDAFLTDPQDFVPGTEMPFKGLDFADERAALIAYLKIATER